MRRQFVGWCYAFAVCSAATLGSAADSNAVAYTDPAKAGADYELQGEYAGTAKSDQGERRWGAQIIALGDGKFETVGYEGGLPGDGWSRGGRTERKEVEATNGKLTIRGEEWDAVVADGKIAVTDKQGNPMATLKRVERKSPTLGAKAPAGATVLFDGTSTDAFENGELIEGKLLGATGCVTKAKFKDHSLHVEFRTPFMPTARGQGRGNSGVYIQGRYELQVLDSFGLEGENNECGGIYSISKPIVNMCLPPLVWQTYDIDFTAARYDDSGKKVKNARVTIKHNGVVIHDNLELTAGTPGYHPEGPEADGLFLQNHGNPVAFRNIWVVDKSAK